MARKVYVNGKQKTERVTILNAHVGDINKMMESARERVRRGKSAKVPDGDLGKLKRPE